MHYDICIMCTIRIQMRVLQRFVQSGNCGKTSLRTAGCDRVNSSLRAKKRFADVCCVYWNNLKWKVTVLKRQAKTALLTLPPCWLHSINNLAHSHLRAHVAHATHLEIKATQGSKGEKTKKKQRVPWCRNNLFSGINVGSIWYLLQTYWVTIMASSLTFLGQSPPISFSCTMIPEATCLASWAWRFCKPKGCKFQIWDRSCIQY